MKKAVLICFSVKCKEFDSNYERNKFFRDLYGWKQTVRKENKKYEYHREGLLDDIPHLKVHQSSFFVENNDFERIMDFFEEWADKVMFKSFKVLLEEDIFE